MGDVSGNAAGLITPVNSAKGKKTIVGVPFDQYFKAQADVRYYYALSTKARLANRIIVGLGYPYGNSRQLPFVKQFFIGGNNSLRAFQEPFGWAREPTGILIMTALRFFLMNPAI